MGAVLVALLLCSNAPAPMCAVRKTSLSKYLTAPRSGGPSYAYFEFAPVSGVGMGVACACTTPTGLLDGGVAPMTFTRASAESCDKSNGVTGILPGDLTECSSGQPSVATGGSGALKLGVWSARTNMALRSEEIDNVGVWPTGGGIGVPDPVVTADVAQGPCGAWDGGACYSGAERVVCSATTAVQRCSTYQAISANLAVLSFYIKGCIGGAVDGGCVEVTAGPDGGPIRVSDGSPAVDLDGGNGSGVIDFGNYNGAWLTGPGSYTATSYTRLFRAAPAVSSYITFGNMSDQTGVVRQPFSILVWGVDLQEMATTVLTPHIHTAGTVTARVAAVATFSVPLTGATRSMAATWITPNSFLAAQTPLETYFDTNNREDLYATSTAATSTVTGDFRIAASSNAQVTVQAMSPSTSYRLAAYYDGTNKATCLDGVCVTSAVPLTLPTGTATVYVGSQQAGTGTYADGWVGQLCIGDSTRCR